MEAGGCGAASRRLLEALQRHADPGVRLRILIPYTYLDVHRGPRSDDNRR